MLLKKYFWLLSMFKTVVLLNFISRYILFLAFACLSALLNLFFYFIFFPLAFHRKPSGNTNSPSWRVHRMTARHEWSSCSRIQRINRSKWRSECVYMRILGWNVKSTIMLYKQRIFFGFTILVWLFWCQIYHSFDKIVKGDDIFNPVNPDIWNNRNYYNCFFLVCEGIWSISLLWLI